VRSVGSFRSRFELADRALGESRIAVKIVRIEDRADVAEAAAGQPGDLQFGTAGELRRPLTREQLVDNQGLGEDRTLVSEARAKSGLID
jgi:hypothetical protein